MTRSASGDGGFVEKSWALWYDLLHEIFGAKTDGHHARSALGFSSLPFGAAVEVEAIFEIKE